LFGTPGNFAAGGHASIQEGGGDALQLDIPIGAVDDRLEFGGEMDGVFAASNVEVGNVDAAVGFDVLQDAAKLVIGGEHSGNALEDAEIGVLKGVMADDSGLAGIAGIPRAELTFGVNFTGRQRIVQRNVVLERRATADRRELQSVNIESERIVGVGAIDLNGRAVGNDLSDASGGRGFVPGSLLDRSAERRDVNAKLSEDDAGDVAGTQEKLRVAGLDHEALDGGDWRGIRRSAQAGEDQILGDASGIREKSGMKFLDGDGGGKTFLEGLGETRLRERPMERKDYARDSEADDQDGYDGKNNFVAMHGSGLAILNGDGDRGLDLSSTFSKWSLAALEVIGAGVKEF
jgi:hypothetical protein